MPAAQTHFAVLILRKQAYRRMLKSGDNLISKWYQILD